MKLALVIFVAVLAGGVIGWMIRSEQVVDGEGGEEILELESRRSVTRSRGADFAKVNSNQEMDRTKIISMNGGELKQLMDSFENEAGLYGLSWEEQAMLELALLSWYDKEPGAVLEWVKNLNQDNDRIKLLTKICEKVAKGNLDEGIVFVKEHLRSERNYLLPPVFIEKAGLASAEKLLEVTRLGFRVSGGTVQYVAAGEFARGFDFQKALEGLKRMSVEGASGSWPAGLLGEWVKVDPEGSYEWLKAGGKNTSEGRLDEYLRGFSAIRSSAEVGEFLGNHFSGGEESHRDYLLVSDGFARKPEVGLLEAFYEHAGGDKVRHAAEILGRIGGASPNSPKMFTAVLESLSVEEQETMFQRENIQKRLGHQKIRQNMENSLMSLGYTVEEAAAILPAVQEDQESE